MDREALLLINPQNADPFAAAGDWLKALKTAAGVSGERQGASRRSDAEEEPAASALRLNRGTERLLIFSQIDEIGCVPEADIYRPGFDFTGVERLAHRPDEELLLRALVQTFLDHSLCIAEDTSQGRHLVFPSQYRREKDIPYEPNIFVSYTFSGEWQTVFFPTAGAIGENALRGL